jgi:hypothetical protein
MVVQRNGITRTELIVVIGIIGFLALIVGLIMPHMGRLPAQIRLRVLCGTNLKNLVTAMTVYANDHQDQFPQLPGTGPWSKTLGFEYDLTKPDFKEGGKQGNVDRTITASWYLLVKYADVLPKDFECPADNDVTSFNGRNLKQLDTVELWDFGAEPHKHVSYAMHNPYGAYPAGKSRPSSFAIAADMSPWFRLGDFVKPDVSNRDWRENITLLPNYFSGPSVERRSIDQSNVWMHGREGQNVAYADNSCRYAMTTDIGVKHDNIYTFWSATENPTENDIRIGTNPTARDKDNDAKSADDSFLAI